MSLPPPPSREKDITGPAWQKWFSLLKEAVSPVATGGKTLWDSISKAGSRLTDIESRSHADLQNLNSDTASHLTGTELSELTGGGKTNVHKHDHALQLNLNSTNYTHLTAANHTDLTDGGDTTLHTHDFDHVTFPAAYTLGGMTHVYTLQELMSHEWSAGIVDGAVLTDNGNGTVSLSEATATIRASTNPHGTLYGAVVAAQVNIALTDNSMNYLYLAWNAGVPVFQVTTSELAVNGLDLVPAYEIHRQGNVLHYLDVRNRTIDSIRKTNNLVTGTSRFWHDNGGTVIGANVLAITCTAGIFHRGVEPYAHVAFDTSVAGTANANVFGLWKHVAGVYTETQNTKVIDTTLYDNGTGPVTLGNNKFGVTWFYLVNDSPSELHAVMGQAQYATLADARVASPPAILPTLLSGLSAIIGFVAYEKSNTVFDGVYSSFAPSFIPSVATVHNGLSGLQGGTIGEYYHLTAAEYAALGATAITLATARQVATLRV